MAKQVDGNNQTNLGEPIGYVATLTGNVTATGANGLERQLQVGDPVYANDLIATQGVSTIVVELIDGTRMDLGRNAKALLDEDVFDPAFAGDTTELSADIDAIQQAILAGVDPAQAAQATAAGADGSGADGGGGFDSGILIDLTAQRTTPLAGYETQSFSRSSVQETREELLPAVEEDTGGSTGNNPPVATASRVDTGEDVATTFAAYSDPDSGDTLTVVINDGSLSGNVTDNGDGTFTYNPAGAFEALGQGQTASDSFSYTVTDSAGNAVSSTVTVTITGTNDAPLVTGTVIGVIGEDAAVPLVVDLLSGASDAEGDALTVSNLVVNGGDASGVTVSGNSLIVDPSVYGDLAVSETEVITYSYDVLDGNGAVVNQTATITITGANDSPSVATAISASAGEDDAVFSIDLLAGTSDPDVSDTLNVSNLTLTGGDASGVNILGNRLSVDPGVYNSLAVGESEVITYSYDVVDSSGGATSQTATVTISGSNDGPTVGAGVTAGAGEGDATFSVDLLAGAADVDSSDTLNVANLTLTGGDASGVALVGNSLSVDPSVYNGLAVGETEVISYSFDMVDGNGGVVAQTATVTISGANDGPTVGAAVTAGAGEDDATFSVDLLAGAGDVDSSDTLSVANLTLTSGDASGVALVGNSLSVDPSAYISLAIGESEVISYSYDVADGNGGVVAQTATITITGGNDAPTVGAAIAAGASEDDASFNVDLLAGAGDVDSSDTLNVDNLILTGGDASGVSVVGNSLSVDPTAYNNLAVGESEIITYSFDVTDSNGGVAAQTATVTISGANDGPTVGAAVTAGAGEDDASFSVDLLAGATDLDSSDSLTVANLTLTGGDASGVALVGNSLSIDPSAYNGLAVGESEIISYSYDVIDGNGGVVAQTTTVTISGANDGPTVGAAVTAGAGEDDASFSIDLLAGAGDVDAFDTLNVANLTLTGGDASGVALVGNSLSVDPSVYDGLAVGESEAITYTFDVVDGNGGVVAQTATITISGTNDGPTVGAAIAAGASEDDASFSIDLLAGAGDVDSSDTLNVDNLILTGGDASGVSVVGNSLSVDPTAYNNLAVGESEIITYSFDVTDSNGGVAAQTATVTISGANDGPTVGAAISAGASEDDATFSVDLLAGASDVDTSDTLNVANLSLTGGDASGVTLVANSLSVDPTAYNNLAVGESEIITYSFDVTDSNGGVAAQTATVTISGANDGPTVGAAVTAGASEDDASFSVDLLAGATDVDSSDTLTVANLTPTGGDASGVALVGNSLSVDPNAYNSLAIGESEVISYSYDVIDGNGGVVAQTASITITGTNDAPTVGVAVTAGAGEDDASFNVDLLAGATDVDSSDTLTVANLTLTGGDASGVALVGNSLSVDPSAYNSLAAGDSEVITYSYDVIDSNGGTVAQTATITITGTNDGPAVGSVDLGSTLEDTSIVITAADLLANSSDVDGDTLNVTSVTLVDPLAGSLSAVTDASGNVTSLTFTPSADFNGADIGLDFTVSDGIDSAFATANIDVTAVNDAPVAVSDSAVTGGTDVVVIDVLANDTDIDGGTLRISAVDISGTLGSVTIAADGSNVTYDPGSAFLYLVNGETATDTFTYTVSDGMGGTTSETVTVTVTGTNSVPVANVTTGSVEEAALETGSNPTSPNEVTSGSLDFASAETAQVTTVNGIAVSGTGTTTIVGTYGVLVIDADGGYSYTLSASTTDHLDPDQTGSADPVFDVFNYNVTDASGDSANSELRIGINDDGPSAVAVTDTVDELALGSTTNLVVVYDRSGSMRADPDTDGFGTRLELANAALNQMFDGYAAAGNVNILIVDFAATASNSGWFNGGGSVASANAYLSSLSASGATDYEAALAQTQSAYGTPLAADQTLVYFISDGQPNDGTFGAAQISSWESFLSSSNVDKAYAVGVGADIDTTAGIQALEGVAYPNSQLGNPIVVTDEGQLVDTLFDTVQGPPLNGNVADGSQAALSVNFGADDGYIKSINVDGTVYEYDPSAGQINVAGTLLALGALLEVETALGGELAFDFTTGAYTYQPPRVESDRVEIFTYTVVDNDGDEASASLTININDVALAPIAADDVVLTNIVDGSTIEIPDWALLANDQNLDGGSIQVTSVLNAASGDNVTQNAIDETVEYTPDGARFNNGSFDYTAGIGDVDSNQASVTINAVNNNRINGRNADEILVGRSSSDDLRGNGGDDILIGHEGDDSLRGGRGNDILDGGDGNDTLRSGSGSDLLIGGDGDDVLYGESDSNTLVGGRGDDTLVDAAGVHNTVVITRDDVDNGIDHVYGFDNVQNASYGDFLDISDVLGAAGYDPNTDNLSDYIDVSYDAGTRDVTVSVDVTGSGASYAEVAVLHNDSISGGSGAPGVDSSASLTQMLNDGTLIVS